MMKITQLNGTRLLTGISDIRNKILKGAVFNTNSVESCNDQAMNKNEAVILASVSNNNNIKGVVFNVNSVESCNDQATQMNVTILLTGISDIRNNNLKGAVFNTNLQ